jgi:hypothetical protein
MTDDAHHGLTGSFPANRTPADRAALTRLTTHFGAIYAIRFRPDEDGVEAVPRKGGAPAFAATPDEMGQILADLTGDKTWRYKATE